MVYVDWSKATRGRPGNFRSRSSRVHVTTWYFCMALAVKASGDRAFSTSRFDHSLRLQSARHAQDGLDQRLLVPSTDEGRHEILDVGKIGNILAAKRNQVVQHGEIVVDFKDVLVQATNMQHGPR